MAKELYLRLFRELNENRFDSGETAELLQRLGGSAQAFRGFAHARRHAWTSARADFLAALDEAHATPLLRWLCGAGLFATRDYDLSLTSLNRAAAEAPADDPIGISTRARKLGLKLATALGWAQDARLLRETIATQDIAGSRHLQARSLELRRQAAIRRRAQQAVEGKPDEAASRSYALLFRDGPSAAAEALELLRHRFPKQIDVLAARLRIDLLLGELAHAEQLVASLPKSLQDRLPAERAALALARGDSELALALTDTGENDPRLLYLRALALRQSSGRYGEGRYDEVAELLERARVCMPGSLAISLALAVVRHQHDPNRFDEDLERRFDLLLADAPGLISDAAASLRLELWNDQEAIHGREPRAEILNRALEMLTPECDVNVTSYLHEGADGLTHLRHVAPTSVGETHLRRLHREDHELVEQHEATLVWSIGVSPPRPKHPGTPAVLDSPSAKPWTPRSLTPAQLEQFMRDGMLLLPNAFDPEIARRWRTNGVQRIREQPEQWVRGYDPNDPARSLRDFDPDDPETWTWIRIDLTGPESVEVPEFAPTAWAAICDLLGGPDRISSSTWSEYLILNLRDPNLSGNDEPSPRASSWHIDDPNPVTRIDQIRNGLVCIALFNDLGPRAGNTWLALDSVPLVARELAAHPEGVDFVNERVRGVTEQCTRFHEVVGNTGDIFLLHPLMMHSASRNRSGRIRWMANPMVYLREPLNPFRPVDELSPVELVIHRAITSTD